MNKWMERLLEREKEGTLPDLLLFWGHKKLRQEAGPWMYSQWWEGNPFTVEGITYPTAEHFMMAAKAYHFNDLKSLTAILNASSPKIAKDLGRSVENYNENVWQKVRVPYVIKGNIAKFSQNAELRDLLLSTERKVLVEASPYDKIWGIGLGPTNPDALFPSRWKGENLLGFALCAAREAIK